MATDQSNLLITGAGAPGAYVKNPKIANTNLYGDFSAGSKCYKSGKYGTLKMVNGSLSCVLEGSENMPNLQTMDEEVLKEAAQVLTFTSPSRTALAAAYRYWKTYLMVQNGNRGLIVSNITDTAPWKFTVSSNRYNHDLDLKYVNPRVPANVTVSASSVSYVRPTFDSQDAKRDAILESVKSKVEKALGLPSRSDSVREDRERDQMYRMGYDRGIRGMEKHDEYDGDPDYDHGHRQGSKDKDAK
jgi:hypothetical protein